jgi:hypothetical protein
LQLEYYSILKLVNMHNKNNQRLTLKLNKKTVILLNEQTEKYRTGNQKIQHAAIFTNGGLTCVTATLTVSHTKESNECTVN